MITISITDEQATQLVNLLEDLRLAGTFPFKIDKLRPVEEKLAAEIDDMQQIQHIIGVDRDS